ncbi:NAD(P)H-binding protein [Jannaschia pohangensis]|uniref:Divinyl chlorophyllide a 8-vinyl-reductase, chloroplastic n=1 Tax=Jannaschia pohangensis TaxID=390807 RepID=A0A1I3RAY4_9RHOB|nr:NAD(P)H-binding protein [Jannaschia pohangensis]SFJ43345.1 divinylchlorophyllide 8-vinylreductase [Jannaschia pohangensis]
MAAQLHSILLAGATGAIGRAVAWELLSQGFAVTALLRPESDPSGLPEGVAVQVAAPEGTFDAVVSCIASRTGTPADAWAVDHRANLDLLAMAQTAGAGRFLLLSAICVQKPDLAFQQAKLAFEAELAASGLDWTVVRPTAFFKSLSGQVARVQAGKPFLAFGDGTVTACKPISDGDLARFVARTLTDPATHGTILPIGGPGPAITPRDQATILSDLLGRPVPVRRIPPILMDAIVGVLDIGARIVPGLRDKAALARIGRYYATESMLVWDAAAGRYDADATPEYGTETLRDHYAALLRGDLDSDLGQQAVFGRPKA